VTDLSIPLSRPWTPEFSAEVLPEGLVLDMPIDAYHGDRRAISKSGLDLINRSPAHYFAAYLDDRAPPRGERAGQLEGTLAHCAILEPAEFDERYAVLPADAPDRPTDAMRNAKNPSESSIRRVAFWDAFEAENRGKRIITHAQREVALRQAESVWKLPEVAQALGRGAPEQSAYWVDPKSQALCRCRPDWVHNVGTSGVILLDVKTYSDASPDEFARQVARKRYHVQQAFYSDGWYHTTRREVLAFVFVAVEMEFPHVATPMCISQPGLEQGRREYDQDLATYMRCVKAGEWPAHSDTIVEIDLPNWAISREFRE